MATFYEINRPGAVWLDFLWVEPEERGRLVATQLMELVKSKATELGCHTLLLGTNQDNAAMQAVAKRAGLAIDHIVMSGRITP